MFLMPSTIRFSNPLKSNRPFYLTQWNVLTLRLVSNDSLGDGSAVATPILLSNMHENDATAFCTAMCLIYLCKTACKIEVLAIE